MGVRPVLPARFLKTQHIVAALIPALIVVVCISGFVWAQKEVTVVVDGASSQFRTQVGNVESLLADANVAVNDADLVTPPLGASLADGMTVVVRHAVPITLDLGGDIIEVAVVGSTVADALIAVGADPADDLAVDPAVDTKLTPGMRITAPGMFVRVVQEEAVLLAGTVTHADPSLQRGSRTLVAAGVPGTCVRVYRVLMVDGQERSRTLTAQRVITPAIPEIIAVGTAAVPKQAVYRRPSVASAAAPAPGTGTRLTVSATGYAVGTDGVDSRTATGARARFGIIAVDPKVIPLGTRLYVPGYGYGVAADTGGAIRGNKIDLCFDSRADALNWGRRTVTVIILP